MQILTCVLLDYDDFNPDDEIGRCELPLKDLTEETQDLWLEVDMEADGVNEDTHDQSVQLLMNLNGYLKEIACYKQAKPW